MFFKKKKAIPAGLTSEEYNDVAASCANWITIEKTLGIDAEKKELLAYHNICSLNLLTIGDVDTIFKPNEIRRTKTRLIQMYLNICFRFGNARVDVWSQELQTSLIKLKPELNWADTVRAVFKQYPYLVLIPILNAVYTHKSITG